MRRPTTSMCGVFLVLVTSASCLSAAGKADRLAEAKELIFEALGREIYGDSAERERLLEAAAKLAPELDAIHWHRGEVRFQNRWQSPEEVADSLASQRLWVRYERRRSEARETLTDQRELANWCRENGMPEQERAHLTAALQIAPNHAETRARLGFRRVNGIWVSAEDIAAAREKVLAEQKALDLWRAKIEQLDRGLRHRSQARRQAAADRIKQLDDPQAIPALEAVLSATSQQGASLVIEAVAEMPEFEATHSLVRHAVFLPWEEVRAAAAEKLCDRDQSIYVPVLLSSMYTPVVSRIRIARDEGGDILYRHAFLREGQSERQLMVLDAQFSRIARPGGDGNATIGRGVARLANSAARRELQVVRQNWLTQQLNQRITFVLNLVTDQDLAPSPDKWWQWWNDENEVFVSGEKTLQTAYRSEQIVLADQTTGAQTKDCLAAGTPVWTATGPKPVERVRVGDFVLAQDPETGELAYKAVLQTTVRPAGPLVRVEIGNECFETSGGHLFWSSGEGWVKARNLKPGMQVHTLSGPRQVVSSEAGSQMETYNLVVADFATYVVGREKLLSHDNTIRQPTAAVVPGLIEW